jgi:PPM family protein phosphatase
MADHYFGATDTGRMRSNNEDAYIAGEVMEGRLVAACVIDGVGGYDGGEIAAALARETILKILSFPSEDIEKTLRAAVNFSNDKIFEEKEHNPSVQKMACVLTLALADVEGNRFYYAHIGDTRLYLFRDQSLVKVTKDHSFVGFLEDSGKLTEEAAMRHPKRNEINKALGFDPQFHLKPESLETGSSPFLPGDVLLLCSDGLTDMVNNQTMIDILSTSASLQEKTTALIEAANNAGGKDNITVVLVHNHKQKQQHEVKKPYVAEPKPDMLQGDGLPQAIDHQSRFSKPEEPEQKTASAHHGPEKPGNKKKLIIGILVGLLILASLLWVFTSSDPDSETDSGDSATTYSRQLVNDTMQSIPGAGTIPVHDSTTRITDSEMIKQQGQ